MSRQRPFRITREPVWARPIGVSPALSRRPTTRQTGPSDGNGRAAVLLGVSLALHLALAGVAAFVVRPIRETPPATVELVIERPASVPSVAEPVQADRPAVPIAAPESPLVARPPMPDRSEPPPSAADPAPEPEPATPARADLAPPAPLPPATPRPPEPARRPPARPRPVMRATPQPPPANGPDGPISPRPPAPAPASAPVATPAPMPNGAWRGALAAWVQSRKRYPDEARRQRAEGTVGVRFTVARDGRVLDAQLVRGSGSDLLDQAALAMFRGARAPQFPAEMAQEQVSITVGIRYRLEE